MILDNFAYLLTLAYKRKVRIAEWTVSKNSEDQQEPDHSERRLARLPHMSMGRVRIQKPIRAIPVLLRLCSIRVLPDVRDLEYPFAWPRKKRVGRGACCNVLSC